MRTVVFDLDGTLADTGADLIAATNTRFQALGHGDLLHPERDKLVAFRGIREMLELGFSRLDDPVDAAEVELQFPLVVAAYAAEIDRFTQLYPGVEAAVESLLEGGYRTAICTNKPVDLAEDLMQRLGVRGLFGAVVGAGSLRQNKPDPAPYLAAVERAGGTLARSFMVGDTITDHDTARAAGVASVLVTFGPAGRDVAALGPDALLDDYAALAGLADRLVG
ncbi:MAG: HAD-IA family hydrolase [Halocynthiibacter sp.]